MDTPPPINTTECLTVPVPAATQQALRAAAEQLHCSPETLAGQVIDSYLDIYQWQAAEIARAVAEADVDGRFFSSVEIQALVARYKT